MPSPLRLVRVAAVAALACVACRARAPVPVAPPSPPDCATADLVDVLHHEIALTVDLAPASMRGRGELRVRTHGRPRAVALDAHRLHVSEATVDGAPMPFTQAEGRVCVALPHDASASSAAPDAERRLTLAWDVPTTGPTPHVASDQAWAGYDAAAWMPTRQDPAQRATLALELDVPSELTVAGPGARADAHVVGERTRHRFVLDRPSPPFLFGFAVGRFDEASLSVSGLTLRAIGRKGLDLRRALDVTATSEQFLREHLGVSLPDREYVQVFVDGDAAQEAAGLSFLAADSLSDLARDPTEDWIFTHELAHQWFAWLVPCADFRDFWLNEGFATFLVAAAKEARWGRAAYDREVALWTARSKKVHESGKDAPLSLSGPDAMSTKPPTEKELQPRGVTYSRGALVLDRLRTELGDDAFWRGLRIYVRDRAGKDARSEDLRRALESASGKDLKGFFEQWVYRSWTE